MEGPGRRLEAPISLVAQAPDAALAVLCIVVRVPLVPGPSDHGEF